MSGYTPVKGDRVRVTFEGTFVSDSSVNWFDLKGASIYRANVENLTVEKIEPPVEQFKPGDVVRRKDAEYTYALGLTSYTHVGRSGNPGASFAYDSGIGLDYFTSDDFEKVDL